MDAGIYLIMKSGTARFRRNEIRKAKRGEIPLVDVKDDKGNVTGAAKPVYVSHMTTVPSSVYVRDTAYRRQDTPWRKRKEDPRGTTTITCKLVPVVREEA